MPVAVYALCALTSLVCAVQLLRVYRGERINLLLWTALCFCGLAANNMLMFIDALLDVDLVTWRKLPALAGVLLLLHGFISDSR
jgi:hypothetical protein